MRKDAPHPWKLVAPWYRWPRQVHFDRVAASPRETVPVLQKFDDPSFVDQFLADPQRSLVFDGFRDHVQRRIEKELGRGDKDCRRTTVWAPRDESTPQSVWLCPTDIKKIYLDIHRRYYLVVCELHCDRPYFPRVTFDQVARAGFVVRRRWTDVPKALKREATRRLEPIIKFERALADLEETRRVRPAAARRRRLANDKLKASGRFETERATVLEALVAERQLLADWSRQMGVASYHEGWFEEGVKNIGRWRPVEETPDQLEESTFPLYPLRPDPANKDHDGAKQSIYFGVLPTSSLDTDALGGPRFTANQRYEVRCFVQRFDPDCPPPARPEDAHGEVVWSGPSEPYELAKAADPLGCANRIANIEMPDFKDMVALAAVMPPGQLATTRVDQPQQLVPQLDGDGALQSGSFKLGQICFFAIPLITIIAMFVLQLFLPIVIFIFGLWFLLAFKFCIPPSLSVSLDVDLQAELEADLKLGVDLDVKFAAEVPKLDQIKAELGLRVTDEGVPSPTQNPSDALVDQDATVLATMYVHSVNDEDYLLGSPGTPNPNAKREFGPNLLADRQYEPRVTAHWEFA